MTKESLNLDAIRARLNGKEAPEFWRSLDELAGTAAFQELLDREFPRGASELRDPVTRRTFLKLMGASLALGGLTSCQFALKQPQEKIVPYVKQPELVIPGRSLFFATAYPTASGEAIGLLAESHEGRPTKLEGNPEHPASVGATDAFTQASILDLYDPDRSQEVLQGGQKSDFAAFLAALGPAIQAQGGAQGAGLRILSGPTTSPTLIAGVQSLLGTLPQARWVQYEPAGRDSAREGARLAFGQDVHTIYRFDQATTVVSLDSDFMSEPGSGVRYQRDFTNGRRVRAENKQMNRFYAVEPTLTVTGHMADHRLRARAAEVENIARFLASTIGVAGASPANQPPAEAVAWANAAAADLQASRGAGIVIAGNGQPPVVHAIAHAINAFLGNAGATVQYVAPVEADPAASLAALQALTQEMAGGTVQLLVMLGGANPVYDAPADVGFAQALGQVPLSVHHGLYADETAAASTWHVPETHYLESWGDARSFDGTATVIQPLIAPLYTGSRTAIDLVNALGGSTQTTYETVQAFWQGQGLPGEFRSAWQTTLHDGIVPDSQAEPATVTLNPQFAPPATAPVVEGLEIVFRPDPTIHDGRYANNGWLQELPKPFTKLVWDNSALISPATAARLGVANGDVVALDYQGRTVEAPVWVLPGQADEVVTVHLGYGRSRVGRVGAPEGGAVGFNANAIRTIGSPAFGSGLAVRPLGRDYILASTQGHFAMEGRKKDLVRSATLEQFVADEEIIHEEKKEIISLFPEYQYNGYAWGMAIDLNVCTNCNACVVACQAENNIPVIGKEEVYRGREMHWIRIDQYYSGELDNPQVYNMVMLCQHCENAPCEIVCPVNATVHDSEGLNNMVYNRCVGTKYCSNNCPYKVRRFNFLQYVDETTPQLKMQRNPDVTVRARGVMEKCTFCVQRINEARIDTERQGLTITDGMVQTACQQVCPTQAIFFGNINDANAVVTKLHKEPLSYGSLDKLNTRPRVQYMAKLKNVNPALAGEEKAEA